MAYFGPKDVQSIFSNVELILNISNEMLQSLSDRYEKWTPNQCIGDIFLKMGPFLKLYIQYVNNYEHSLETLERLEKNPLFQAFYKARNKEGVNRTMGLSLPAYLIMPVQRVPRYSLLLKELLRYTPEDHPDYQTLSQALEQMNVVAATINEAKREEENKRKVRHISELLGHKCENLMQPQRRFVFQGELITNSDSFCQTGQERVTCDPYPCFFFLFNDLLVIATRPRIATFSTTMKRMIGEEDQVYKFQEKIPLNQLTVGQLPQDTNGQMYGIFLQMERRIPDHFFLPTRSERDEWMTIFQDTISQTNAKRSTLKL
jgi:hypothetical protein